MPKGPAMSYSKMPTKNEWEKNVGGPSGLKRKGKYDRILARISDLIKEWNAAPESRKRYLECELYFSTQYWNRNEAPKPTQKDAASHVKALFDLVEIRIAKEFNCPTYGVAPQLQKLYCCTEQASAIFKDEYDIPHTFQKRGDLEKFKLYFVQDKAKWSPWWENNKNGLVLVNTKDANDAHKGAAAGQQPLAQSALGADAAFFVMNRYRDMYAAPHYPRVTDFPMYHSTIPHGQPIQYAGSILIEKGIVRAICDDSGHYKPGVDYVINVLEHFKTLGVPLSKIEVWGFDGKGFNDRGDAKTLLDSYKDLGFDFDGVRDRARDRQHVRHEEAAAIRGQIYSQRFKNLPGPKGAESEWKAKLDQLCADRYNELVRGGMRATPENWKNTWKDVFEALSALWSESAGVNAIQERKIWIHSMRNYMEHPAAPPRPSVGPPVVPRPVPQPSPASPTSKFQTVREAWEKGTVWKKTA